MSVTEEIKTRLQALSETDLPALRKQLDSAGVPWTPGRSVPGSDR